MHDLGLGGMEFPSTHALDDHRPVGYIETAIAAAETIFDEPITDYHAARTQDLLHRHPRHLSMRSVIIKLS